MAIAEIPYNGKLNIKSYKKCPNYLNLLLQECSNSYF